MQVELTTKQYEIVQKALKREYGPYNTHYFDVIESTDEHIELLSKFGIEYNATYSLAMNAIALLIGKE